MAWRISYEARAGEKPGDLSLCWGLEVAFPDELDLADAGFLGFGTRGNSATLLRVPCREPVSAAVPLIQPGKWHQVTVTRENGRITAEIDGAKVLEAQDAAKYPGSFIGLYCWNDATFRSLKVWCRSWYIDW